MYFRTTQILTLKLLKQTILYISVARTVYHDLWQIQNLSHLYIDEIHVCFYKNILKKLLMVLFPSAEALKGPWLFNDRNGTQTTRLKSRKAKSQVSPNQDWHRPMKGEDISLAVKELKYSQK